MGQGYISAMVRKRTSEEMTVLHGSSCACLVRDRQSPALDHRLHLLSRPRRPRRPGEWTTGAAIMFLVTLAARKSVTLAARSAGMSRKSAYALKARDPAFAEAWIAALAAPSAPSEGDRLRRSAPSNSSSKLPHPKKVECDAMRRDRFFAALRESRKLAPAPCGQ